MVAIWNTMLLQVPQFVSIPVYYSFLFLEFATLAYINLDFPTPSLQVILASDECGPFICQYSTPASELGHGNSESSRSV